MKDPWATCGKIYLGDETGLPTLVMLSTKPLTSFFISGQDIYFSRRYKHMSTYTKKARKNGE